MLFFVGPIGSQVSLTHKKVSPTEIGFVLLFESVSVFKSLWFQLSSIMITKILIIPTLRHLRINYYDELFG